MLKLFRIMAEGQMANAEEALADRNALLILHQQARVAAADVERGRRALGLTTAQDAAEGRRLAGVEARLAEIEGGAVAALRGGREDLAAEAAAAIASLEVERDALREARRHFGREIEALRLQAATAEQRLAAVERGRRLAAAAEAVQRLRGQRLAASCEGGALREAEATLARLREKQAEADHIATVLDEAPRGTSILDRLQAEGFAPPAGPTAAGVLNRLRRMAETEGETPPAA